MIRMLPHQVRPLLEDDDSNLHLHLLHRNLHPRYCSVHSKWLCSFPLLDYLYMYVHKVSSCGYPQNKTA